MKSQWIILNPTLSSEATFDFTSPTVTLRYMPSRDLNFYVTYGTGFRPGAIAASVQLERIIEGPCLVGVCVYYVCT